MGLLHTQYRFKNERFERRRLKKQKYSHSVAAKQLKLLWSFLIQSLFFFQILQRNQITSQNWSLINPINPWTFNRVPRIRLANSGWNPSHGRILYFHARYSNMNILSLWYRNQAIQKPKFIYTYKTATFMTAPKWDKIFLKNRIAKTRVGILLAAGYSAFTLDIQKGISWASDIKIRGLKNLNSSTHTGLQLSWRIQSDINLFWRT